MSAIKNQVADLKPKIPEIFHITALRRMSSSKINKANQEPSIMKFDAVLTANKFVLFCKAVGER